MTQAEALTILKTGANVFLTGEPGSGKTYTINQYVEYLRAHHIEAAITASTGIAATHIGGLTLHSWSGIGIHNNLDLQDIRRIAKTRHVETRMKHAHVLIIDEVSMLAPATLNLVEAVCRESRKNQSPFGGLQVIFVGDFFQLPPVKKRKNEEDPDQIVLLEEPESTFAYDASAWVKADPQVCYLTEQHRQDDSEFLSVLSAIRSNTFGMKHVGHIESRRATYDTVPEMAPKLFSHNMDVDLVNNDMISQLPGEMKEFRMKAWGPDPLLKTLKKGCLSPEVLNLKIGASVMFTKNNHKVGFVNGTLGVVEGFRDDDGLPIIKTRRGVSITAEPMDWAIQEEGETRASITQVPLRLAWAITVHKSQGMSLDEAVMDLSEVFEYGQGYVALSRVRNLAGVHLIGWNQRAFQVHPDIFEKDKEFRTMSDDLQAGLVAASASDTELKHQEFIMRCGGSLTHVDPLPVIKEKADTYKTTLAMWEEGKTIQEISAARGIKERTVFDHLEELVKQKALAPENLGRLMSAELKSGLEKIHEAFKELDTDKLTPVFEKFAGKYSYDDIRLARILIEKSG